jgi:hypothetical protein
VGCWWRIRLVREWHLAIVEGDRIGTGRAGTVARPYRKIGGILVDGAELCLYIDKRKWRDIGFCRGGRNTRYPIRMRVILWAQATHQQASQSRQLYQGRQRGQVQPAERISSVSVRTGGQDAGQTPFSGPWCHHSCKTNPISNVFRPKTGFGGRDEPNSLRKRGQGQLAPQNVPVPVFSDAKGAKWPWDTRRMRQTNPMSAFLGWK